MTFKEFICYILMTTVFLPILILVFIVGSIIEYIKTTKFKKPSLMFCGILICMMPAILMGGIYLIWNIFWVFCAFKEIIHIGHPLLIFLGIIVPVVGSVIYLIGCLKE